MKSGHPLIQKAFKEGITFFHSEDHEWMLQVETDEPIEKLVGREILIFANNGQGDFLFLKRSEEDGTFEAKVYTYFHEGPEIIELPDDLEELLGLRERPPSRDKYPQARYESGELVNVGDQVQFRSWTAFWKGWQDGIVTYVPGQSKKEYPYESDGLKWVAISNGGMEIGPLIDPETGIIKKIKLIQRGAYTAPKRRLKREEEPSSCLEGTIIRAVTLILLFGILFLIMKAFHWVEDLLFG